MSFEKTIEKYYLSVNDFDLSVSQQDYVLLNPLLPYVANSKCYQVNLYTQPGSILSGILYSNRTTQTNTIIYTINITQEVILSLDKGILVFIFSRNYESLYVGDITLAKPIFQSGIYEGKNIELVRTILQGDNDLIAEFKIIY